MNDSTFFTTKALMRAIADSTQQSQGKLVIVASGSGVTNTYTIDYSGGLRRPHLERAAGTPDYLDDIVTPIAKP